LLNEVDGDQWSFYRNPQIQFPLASIYTRSRWGIPATQPAILLLHKAVYRPRPKDQHDFERMLPHLHHNQRMWLHSAILSMHTDHPWLSQLAL
jgi:hypothetical protein